MKNLKKKFVNFVCHWKGCNEISFRAQPYKGTLHFFCFRHRRHVQKYFVNKI